MATPAIVIALDIIKHRRPHYFPAAKVFAVDTFHFQRVEEALRTGIVVAASFRAHTTPQVIPLQQCLIVL